MKYRKKPVVIEAIQLTADEDSHMTILKWIADHGEVAIRIRPEGIRISTLEGDHTARVGDWIIKGVKGEFYPCKPDIFAATYEAVEQEPPCETGSTVTSTPSPSPESSAVSSAQPSASSSSSASSPTTNRPGDWPEDFAHENGNYQCYCIYCGEMFYGHKRRMRCKACANPKEPAPCGSESFAGSKVAIMDGEKLPTTPTTESCDAVSSTSGSVESAVAAATDPPASGPYRLCVSRESDDVVIRKDGKHIAAFDAGELVEPVVRELNRLAHAVASERARAKLSEREPDGGKSPLEVAIDEFWRDIILKRKPTYGDWEYGGMAYRHIMCEVEEMVKEATEAERDRAKGLVEALELVKATQFRADGRTPPQSVMQQVEAALKAYREAGGGE